MVAALFLLGCSGSESSVSSPAPEDPSYSSPTIASASGPLLVKGSDREVNLVQRLAEEFMKRTPGASIAVTGGGSGTGIAALLDGTTTIANSSREMNSVEKAEARRKTLDIRSFVLATDGLALIVNASNPLDTVSLDRVAAMYQGEMTTWDAVGAPGSPLGPVSLYGRLPNSGTYDYFKEAAVRGEYATSVKQMNGNAQIIEAVKADPGGIGYVAAGYVAGQASSGIKVLSLVVGDGAPVSPLDEAAVLSGAYPLARPLYQFIEGVPTGRLKQFLAYEASPAGQDIVREMGFQVVRTEFIAKNQALLAGK